MWRASFVPDPELAQVAPRNWKPINEWLAAEEPLSSALSEHADAVRSLLNQHCGR